jgi:hypothetical protein
VRVYILKTYFCPYYSKLAYGEEPHLFFLSRIISKSFERASLKKTSLITFQRRGQPVLGLDDVRQFFIVEMFQCSTDHLMLKNYRF